MKKNYIHKKFSCCGIIWKVVNQTEDKVLIRFLDLKFTDSWISLEEFEKDFVEIKEANEN